MPKDKGAGSNGPTAGEELRLLVERVERLNEEIKELQADRGDVYAEAKSRGFDVPTMKNVVRLRKMDPEKRRSTLALLEIYQVALGMTHGSLSDEAAAFIEASRKGKADAEEPAVDQETGGRLPGKVNAGPAPEGGGEAPPLTVDDARRLGREAAAAGRPVTANPFPARDPRRAAWDEEWCKSAGSDGMEIPSFLRPPPKPEKPDEKKSG